MVKKMNTLRIFDENKFLVVRGAISRDAAKIIGNSLLISEQKGETDIDQAQVIGATCAYSLPIMESVLLYLHRIVEKNTGLSLCPTYTFSRIYREGDELVRHKDRPSCEVSATLTLNYSSDELWPIWVKTVDNKDTSIDLDIGDLMIYRGCEIEHWREKFTEKAVWMQVFIHFIDKNGPYYPDFAFDKRPVKNLYDEIMEKLT